MYTANEDILKKETTLQNFGFKLSLANIIISDIEHNNIVGDV